QPGGSNRHEVEPAVVVVIEQGQRPWRFSAERECGALTEAVQNNEQLARAGDDEVVAKVVIEVADGEDVGRRPCLGGRRVGQGPGALLYHELRRLSGHAEQKLVPL